MKATASFMTSIPKRTSRLMLARTIQDTGLFFFRGEPGRPFAIICPGGGFSYVGAIHEGFPLAIALSRMGYNAFSIQYRTGGAQVACEDLAQAIDFIMRHGFGLGIGTTAEGWEKDAVRFWEKYISRKN